jgi:hypothetical protein
MVLKHFSLIFQTKIKIKITSCSKVIEKVLLSPVTYRHLLLDPFEILATEPT